MAFRYAGGPAATNILDVMDYGPDYGQISTEAMFEDARDTAFDYGQQLQNNLSGINNKLGLASAEYAGKVGAQINGLNNQTETIGLLGQGVGSIGSAFANKFKADRAAEQQNNFLKKLFSV